MGKKTTSVQDRTGNKTKSVQRPYTYIDHIGNKHIQKSICIQKPYKKKNYVAKKDNLRTVNGERALGLDAAHLVGRLTLVHAPIHRLRPADDKRHPLPLRDHRVLLALVDVLAIACPLDVRLRVAAVDATLERDVSGRDGRLVVEVRQQLGRCAGCAIKTFILFHANTENST